MSNVFDQPYPGAPAVESDEGPESGSEGVGTPSNKDFILIGNRAIYCNASHTVPGRPHHAVLVLEDGTGVSLVW